MRIVNNLSLLIFWTGSIPFSSCTTDESPNNPGQEFHHLYKTETILEHDSPRLTDVLERVRGSVGKRGGGSKVIWNRKNEYGAGLYVSANHVYHISGWSSRNPQWFDIRKEAMGIFETSQIPPQDGSLLPGETWSADFPLLHLEISPDAGNSTIDPSQDFYFGIIDNQKVQVKPLPQYPEKPILEEPLELYDPEQRTLAQKTWELPVVGEEVLAMGFPQDLTNFPKGAVALGKVLSDAEAIQTIQLLRQEGDQEGEIPYQPDVEFFIDAQGLPGMSGGGVFNFEGQLLGIMVRASDQKQAPKIIRVIRASYIHSKVLDYVAHLPMTERIELGQFLGEEFQQTTEIQR